MRSLTYAVALVAASVHVGAEPVSLSTLPCSPASWSATVPMTSPTTTWVEDGSSSSSVTSTTCPVRRRSESIPWRSRKNLLSTTSARSPSPAPRRSVPARANSSTVASYCTFGRDAFSSARSPAALSSAGSSISPSSKTP